MAEPLSSPEPFCPVQPLIARIAELERSGAAWSLRASEVRGLLGLGSADFHRRLYAAQQAGNRLVGLDSAGRSFAQENVGELVSLLELFCGPGVEESLARAGIFFPQPEQVQLMGCFLGEVGEALARHRLQENEFSAMLRSFASFERARVVYREEYFPLDELLQRSASRYCGSHSFGLPELARANARRLLEYFFRKHVLETEGLFESLYKTLREQAAREGYVPRQARAEGQAGERRAEQASPGLRARRLLGLEGGELDLRRLKSRYKTLMKIYHPDLNPQGLRRCQEINAAYALLARGLAAAEQARGGAGWATRRRSPGDGARQGADVHLQQLPDGLGLLLKLVEHADAVENLLIGEEGVDQVRVELGAAALGDDGH